MRLRYFISQLKRALKAAFHVFSFMLLLALCVALAASLFSASDDGRKQEIRIGVTGATEDSIIQTGLSLLSKIDGGSYSLSFEIMDEAEALRSAKRGSITGFLRIPEGFMDGVMGDGERIPMTFVSADTSGIGAALTKEIASAVSDILIETENAIYGVQRYTYTNFPDKDWYGESMVLFDRYVAAALDRAEFFELETVGVSHSLSLYASVFCGLLTALIMLSCIGSVPFFSRKDRVLSDMLAARGVAEGSQVISEYAAYLLITLAGAAVLGASALFAVDRFGIDIPEYEASVGLGPMVLGLILCSAVIAAMTFFLCELCPDAANAPLLLFFNAAFQGFAAGCFYPASFLPEAVRDAGAVLPASAALKCLAAGMRGDLVPGAVLPALAWTLVLIAASAIFRRKRRGTSL